MCDLGWHVEGKLLHVYENKAHGKKGLVKGYHLFLIEFLFLESLRDSTQKKAYSCQGSILVRS